MAEKTEKTLLHFAETIRGLIPNGAEVNMDGHQASIHGTIDAGIKGMDVLVEITETTVKIKGNRKYEYPITDANVGAFQQKMQSTHRGFSIYVNGQTLSFSKFFAYQTEQEAAKMVKDAVAAMQDAVLVFEDSCVNFMEKMAASEEKKTYNPEENIEIVKVDNTFHAVSATQQDNEEYEKKHQNYTEEIFEKLAAKIGGRNGNEAVHTDENGRTVKAMAFPLDTEIILSVSIKAPKDTAAMYLAYMNANYKELRSSYHADKEEFIIRGYAYPDPYSPEDTEELLNLCNKAMDACIQNYAETLEKKDSLGFAVDVQQILEEQTETVAQREKAVAAREEEMAAREEEMKHKEEELKQRLQDLETEKKQMQEQMDQEREKMQQREDEMVEKIRDYEERDTKSVLNIKQLANQVAALQTRQNALGTADAESGEELFRMESKVNQLISQKVALEKKLNEKISGKETRIRQLSDVITEKDTEIQKMKNNMNDIVQSLVSDTSKKAEARIEELESQLAGIGHILTPEDMLSYISEFSDLEASKRHASNAEFVVYEDGALEIRIRFGEVNYVDVSREAALKDSILKKLNTKFLDYKFFVNKEGNKITARSYFSKTAKAEEVDDLISALASNFSK